MRAFLREKLSDFRAWRRGERRVAPPRARGRVYESKTGPRTCPTDIRMDSTPLVHCAVTIIRADGTMEEITAPINSVYYSNG
jgi:hypothetical protein